MVKKYSLALLFTMFFLGVTSVNAQNNTSAPTQFIVPTLENLSKNNQLKEGRWYSIDDYNPSYKMHFYDLYELYQSSVISQNACLYGYPVQFIKVGDRYLPHIVLNYVNVLRRDVNIKEIPDYTQYVKMLEKPQFPTIYLSAHSKKEIPYHDIDSRGGYIEVKKNYQGGLDIVERHNLLYMAKVYDYYSDGTLKTETTYVCNTDPETQERCAALFLSIGTYEQGGEHEQLSSKRIQLNGPEDIGHDVLRPLFMQNKVILEKLKKQK